MNELADDLRRIARDRADGRCMVFTDAATQAAARRIARAAGALGTSVVDVRGTSLAAIEKIHVTLRRRGATRRTAVVACGGGALLDAVRIAAALFEGGAPAVLIASTLGAAIDRGVDPVARRGAAHVAAPPAALLVDYCAIPASARDGLGTLVRDAFIEGDDFFDGMESLAPHPLRKWPWQSVIEDALRVDRMHAGDDRRVLELGMPFAAAIAATHGVGAQHALALGLRAACLAGRRIAQFGERDHLRVLAVLALLGFALHHARLDAGAVLAAIPSGTRFALPHAIGDVEADIVVPRHVLRRALERLASTPGAAEFR